MHESNDQKEELYVNITYSQKGKNKGQTIPLARHEGLENWVNVIQDKYIYQQKNLLEFDMLQ